MEKVKLHEKCAYKNCRATKLDNNNIPLHRFPKDGRLQKWIENSGNLDLHSKAASTIRKYGLCNKHFDDTSFVNSDKEKVKWSAIPKPFQEISNRVNYRIENPQSENSAAEHFRVEMETDDNLPEKNEGHSSTGNSTLIVPSASIDTKVAGGTRIKVNPESSEKQTKTYQSIEEHPKNACCEEWCREVRKLKLETTKLFQLNQNFIKETDTLQTKVEDLTEKVKNLERQVRELPKRIEKAKKQMTLDEFLSYRNLSIDPAAKTMIKLQLHKPRTQYDNDERDLAKQLFYHSHSAYSRMRDAGCNFPGESTVRSWIATYDVQPGFCDVIFEILKKKMAALPPDQRLCALAWDEMSIKEYEEYSGKDDLIEGLVDLGPLGRQNNPAKYVFFFNLTSLNVGVRWRQPVAYFLSGKGGMKAEEIFYLLKECLRKLQAADVDVRLLVCDQGVHNQQTFSSMLGIRVNKPTWEFEGKIYYACFDFPHLIKRILSMLRNHGHIWDESRTIVAWDDFIFAKQYDECISTSHLLDHISQIHLTPNSFQAMNVKRAFQIFGRRYAQAIRLAGESREKELNLRDEHSEMTLNDDTRIPASSTWRMSANFAEKLNDMIDACNAYGLISKNPNRRPLSPRNPEVEELITELVAWADKWRIRIPPKSNSIGKVAEKKLTEKEVAEEEMAEEEEEEEEEEQEAPTMATQGTKKKDTVSVRIPPCFTGIQLTGNALVGVYHSIRNDYSNFEFATARGNQDGSEHWFSVLRARGGKCLNPTARMVRYSTRHALSLSSVTIGNQGNAQCEDTNFLTAPESTPLSRVFSKVPTKGGTLEMPNEEDLTVSRDMDEGLEVIEEIQDWTEEDIEVAAEATAKDAREEIARKQRSKVISSAIGKLQQCSLYEANAITYFAGYVAYKVLKSVQCDECRRVILKTPMDTRNDNEKYIEYREYENPDLDAPAVTKLQRPTDKFAKICGIQLQTFERVRNKYWSSRSVLQSIVKEMQEDTAIFDPSWFDESDPCYKHRLKATEFMTRVKIYSQTKANNRKAKTQSRQLYSRNNKMRNVTNQ